MGTPQGVIPLLPERLNAVRKAAELSQVDFAKRLGLSPRGYKNYELGLREVPLSVVSTVHQEFDVDLHWLVYGEVGSVSSQTAEEAMLRVMRSVRAFEKKQGVALSDEKADVVTTYLFRQLLRRPDFSGEEMWEYLQTTL